MKVTPAQRAEFERRGVPNVRAILAGAPSSVRSEISLEIPGAERGPLRGEIEEWLREQDAKAERTSEAKHAELMLWAKIAGIGAVIGAVAAVIAVILALQAL